MRGVTSAAPSQSAPDALECSAPVPAVVQRERTAQTGRGTGAGGRRHQSCLFRALYRSPYPSPLSDYCNYRNRLSLGGEERQTEKIRREKKKAGERQKRERFFPPRFPSFFLLLGPLEHVTACGWCLRKRGAANRCFFEIFTVLEETGREDDRGGGKQVVVELDRTEHSRRKRAA